MSAHAEPRASAEGDERAVVDRIADWSARLQSTESRVELLRAMCEVAVDLTGYEGFWAVRIEPDGVGYVEAARVWGGAPDTTGSVAAAVHLPPGDLPSPRGPAPFFVANVADGASRAEPFGGLAPAARSPFDDYLRFLASIGVRAACSVPILSDGGVWARMIGHHPIPVDLHPALQSELGLLGRVAGVRLQELLDQERGDERFALNVAASKILRNVVAVRSLRSGLVDGAAPLLELCAATSAIVRLDGETSVVGAPLPEDIVSGVLNDARRAFASHDRPVVTRTEMPPECGGHPGGYLALRLDEASTGLVIWIRPGRPGTVRWVEIEQVPDDVEVRAISDAVSQVGRVVPRSSEPWAPLLIEAVEHLRHDIEALDPSTRGSGGWVGGGAHAPQLEADVFARTIAHDLRAPVRAIAQYVEFLMEDAAGRLDPADLEQLRTILRLAGRGTAILDDLARYAELGETDLTPEPNDLPAATTAAIARLDPALVAGAEIHTEDGEILADRRALRQLLASLITNAMIYTSGDAHVQIGIRSLAEAMTVSEPPPKVRRLPGHTPVLFVEDAGVGIAAEHVHRVFGLFKRANEAMPHVGGTGAGLAMCQRIAQRHGGDIWLTSAPTVGTTVFVVLGPASVA